MQLVLMVKFSRRQMKTALAAFALCFWCSTAWADPCEAIPQKGPLPTYLHAGKQFTGPVTYVGDGDSLCVSVGMYPENPAGWVEVRLADFYAPELHEPEGQAAKAVLSRIALGHVVTCTAQHRSYDRVVAACRLRGVSLAQSMRAAGVTEGGRGR